MEMRKWKSYNCPKVKVGDLVRVIDITEGEEEYENDYIDGTVFYVGDDDTILLELDKNYREVGKISGWIADNFEKSKYGCEVGRLYWWFYSWKLLKMKKRLEIE